MIKIIGIYKITNLINGKAYIGQSINIEGRWGQHLRKCKYPCDAAIQKYGKENFSFEVLEECPRSKLNEREVYWIAYYDTYLGYGYNLTPGGDGADRVITISNEMFDKIINLLQDTNLSMRTIAKICSVSSHAISAINAGKMRVKDYFSYPIRKTFNKSKTPIHIDKDTLLNMLEITDYDYKTIGNIYSVTPERIRQICYEYQIELPDKLNIQTSDINCSIVKRKIDNCRIIKNPLNINIFPLTIIPNKINKHKHIYHIPIYQCSTDDEIINSFNSIKQAAEVTGFDYKNIHRALNTKDHLARGYKWIKCDEYERYIKENMDEPI